MNFPEKYSFSLQIPGTKYSLKEFKEMYGEYRIIAVMHYGKLRWYCVFENTQGTCVTATLSNTLKIYIIKEKSFKEEDLEVVVMDSQMYCLVLKWEEVDLGRNEYDKAFVYMENLENLNLQEYYNENPDIFDGEII